MHSTRHTRAGPICNCSNQGATLIGIAACAQPFSVHLCGVALGWLLFPAGILSLRIFKTAMEKVTVGSTAVVPGLAVQYQVCLCSSCKHILDLQLGVRASAAQHSLENKNAAAQANVPNLVSVVRVTCAGLSLTPGACSPRGRSLREHKPWQTRTYKRCANNSKRCNARSAEQTTPRDGSTPRPTLICRCVPSWCCCSLVAQSWRRSGRSMSSTNGLGTPVQHILLSVLLLSPLGPGSGLHMLWSLMPCTICSTRGGQVLTSF